MTNTEAYIGKLSNRPNKNFVELFDENQGYIEPADKAWPRSICFDMGSPSDGLSIAFASNSNALSDSDVVLVREVLSALIDMDDASWVWSDIRTLQEYQPTLGLVFIEGRTVSFLYTSHTVNTNWEVEFEFESSASWRLLR